MRIRLLVVTVMMTAVSAAASAATIDFTGVGKNSVVTLGGIYSGAVYAGELNWSWVGSPPAGFGPSLYTYCVDILNGVTDPETVTVRPLAELTPATSPQTLTGGGALASWLFDTYAAAIHATGTGEQAAGLQLAIWEVLYDSVWSLDAGKVALVGSSAGRTWANSYLGALATSGFGGGSYASTRDVWLDAAAQHGQDQIVAQVPEPAAFMIAVLGLLGFVTMRRRMDL